jgi:phage terminase small subunit
MAKELTRKQELFVAEYLTDLNATRAAIAAGYSKKTACEQGARLLANVKIAQQIAAKHGKRLGKLEISAEKVLQELAKLAFYDPLDLFESDGSVKQIKDIDPITRMAIAGLEVCELFDGAGEQKHAYGLLKKIKLADKGTNLERLGKHLKLFTDKTESSETLHVEHSFDLSKLSDEQLKALEAIYAAAAPVQSEAAS